MITFLKFIFTTLEGMLDAFLVMLGSAVLKYPLSYLQSLWVITFIIIVSGWIRGKEYARE